MYSLEEQNGRKENGGARVERKMNGLERSRVERKMNGLERSRVE